MKTLLCFGMGYCAKVLAADLSRAGGWRIVGTSRGSEGVAALRARGIEALVFDGSVASHELLDVAARASHVLVSASPGTLGDPVLATCREALSSAGGLAWIGYLSTIGVYGDSAGGWVDETTPPRPEHARGVARIEAERAWLAFGAATGKAVQVFRLAGIYGPGRNVLLDLAAGTARHIVKPGHAFNRIHVADVAKAIAAGMDRGQAGRVYNVADDEPASTSDVLDYAARLLGLPVPPPVPFDVAHLSPMLASFYAGNRRVRSARLRRELGLDLSFPTYREGLASLRAHLEPEATP